MTSSVPLSAYENENSTRRAFQRIEELLAGLSTPKRVLLVAMGVFLQYCLIVNSSWNATPDSALYLGLGESLAAGKGYVFNGELHTFVPPGYPLMVAGAAFISQNNFLNYRTLIAVLGLLTAAFCYLLVYRLCGPNTAFLVGGLFGINHVLLDNSTYTLTDVPFALFTLLGLNALLSAARTSNRLAWTVISGCLLGLLPVIRVNGLGVPPVAAFFLFFSWKDATVLRRSVYVVFFLAFAFAPAELWQVYKASFPVSFSEGTYFDALVGRRLQDHLWVVPNAFLGYFEETSYAITGIVLRTWFLEFVAPLVALVGMVVAYRKGDRLLVPLTVVQFCGLLLAAAGSRYLIFLTPGLYLFLALGILELMPWVSQAIGKAFDARRTLVACFALLALLNLGHNFITVFHSRTPLEPHGAQSERSLPFFVAARWLKSNAPDAKVLTTNTRIIHYLSGCRAIPLMRAGAAYHETLVTEHSQVQDLLTKHKPDFLFSDAKDRALYSNAGQAIEALGYRLEEVRPAAIGSRYSLYRIVTADKHAQ